MKKVLFTVCFVAALCFAVTSCGTENTNVSDKDSAVTTAAETTEAETEEVTEEVTEEAPEAEETTAAETTTEE